MSLICKTRPWSYLWLLLLHAIGCLALLAAGAAIDLWLYQPNPDQPGFPFPIVTMLVMLYALGSTIILAIVVTILIVVRRRQLR